MPGLFLAIVIGGANLSAVGLWLRRPRAPLVSLATGILLLVWIAIQTWIIGLRDWTQPLWAAVFLAVTLLAATRGAAARIPRPLRRQRGLSEGGSIWRNGTTS